MNWLMIRLAAFEPRTVWFGAGRSLIAVAQITIMLFTAPAALMQPLIGLGAGPHCEGIKAITAYCVGGDIVNQDLRRLIIIVLLLVVASGYRPRYTVWIHAWICLSIGMSISLPDGGEQVARIVGLLLIPIGLADDRVWQWKKSTTPRGTILPAAAFAAIWALRIQIAIIYFDSGISKLSTDDWTNGSAEYYFVRGNMFGSSGLIYDIMHWATSVPLIVAGLTWGAIIIEVAIGILILGPVRCREVALGLDILLHAVIIATIGLWSFSLIMIGCAIIASAPDYEDLPLVRRLAKVGWIEKNYNRRRRQRVLGKLTPVEFETIHSAAYAA